MTQQLQTRIHRVSMLQKLLQTMGVLIQHMDVRESSACVRLNELLEDTGRPFDRVVHIKDVRLICDDHRFVEDNLQLRVQAEVVDGRMVDYWIAIDSDGKWVVAVV